MSEPKKAISLGYANGWERGKTPEIVIECDKLGHQRWSRKSGNCETEFGCEICHYHYFVDSSG